MNIFILDLNKEMCCKYMMDRHIIKMQLESAQLLSTAVRLSGIDKGYNITHKNHPCAIWVRESLSNWMWLQDLLYCMDKEYKYRFDTDKTHMSFIVARNLPLPNIVDIGLTQFKLAMPDICKTNDVVNSYRLYYRLYKGHIARWTRRTMPYWY